MSNTIPTQSSHPDAHISHYDAFASRAKYSRVAQAAAPGPSLDDMICGSAHRITLQGNCLSCIVCLQGYHVQEKEHVQFLASPCTPSPQCGILSGALCLLRDSDPIVRFVYN